MVRPPSTSRQESALARAKNTSRSEARRRTREQTRAEIAAEQESDDDVDELGRDRNRKHGPATSPIPLPVAGCSEPTSVLCPSMFRTRRLLWLPFILLAVGFVLAIAFNALPAADPAVGAALLPVLLRATGAVHVLHRWLPRAARLVPDRLHARAALTGVLWASCSSPTQSPARTWRQLDGPTCPSTVGTVLIASMVLARSRRASPAGIATSCAACRRAARDRQAQKDAERRPSDATTARKHAARPSRRPAS